MMEVKMLKTWRHKKQDKKWEEESFQARLIMERTAQREMNARLRLVELQYKNMTRQ
jgi:hypothetical protein